MGESDRKVRTWVSRVKPPPLDPSGICNVMQRHISKESWTNGIEKGTTLFIGVPTFATLKVDKQHVFYNRELLKGLLQLNSSGIFNKSTIASALDTLDNTGAMRAKHGSNWGMLHGWFIIQCMAYLKKMSKEYTPKTEPRLVDLIMTMKTQYESVTPTPSWTRTARIHRIHWITKEPNLPPHPCQKDQSGGGVFS